MSISSYIASFFEPYDLPSQSAVATEFAASNTPVVEQAVLEGNVVKTTAVATEPVKALPKNATSPSPIPPAPQPPKITYAPYVKPVTGEYDLCCVAMVWKDNPGPSESAVSASCNATAANFKRLSNGQFNFSPKTYRIAVPYEHADKNVAPAVDYAKKQIKTTSKNVTYALVNNGAGTFSHSGGDTSNILNTLTSTFYHEIGRDNPTRLGSSGAFKNGQYEDQADGTTFMGHFASDQLTASQLYYLGWLPNTQVALYDDLSSTQEFTLAPLNSTDQTSLKAVLIPNAPDTGKPMFLSRPTLDDGAHAGNPQILYALHLAVGTGGTQRLTMFGNKSTTRGIDFTQVSESGTDATIRLSPAPATSETKPETEPATSTSKPKAKA